VRVTRRNTWAQDTRAQKTRLETSSLQPGFVLRHRFAR
jgi:hypothetical protein